MNAYCHNLTFYHQLRNNFVDSSFTSNISDCSTNIELSRSKATLLYNNTKNNHYFIDEMKRGCTKGGNKTACHISKSNANDIVDEFYRSYHNYIQAPQNLCTAFSEYANNLEKVLITGGCYLDNKHGYQNICLQRYKCS